MRPNIVFIMADDLGWSDIGCFGSTYYKTPNIDTLAKRGMVFTQAYATPTCSPSRASIMSGQYSARLGITLPACHLAAVRLKAGLTCTASPVTKCLDAISVSRLDTNIVTLAETLKTAGYATGHFGKWHLGAEPYSPLEQGFDVDVPHTSTPGLPRGYLASWGLSTFASKPVFFNFSGEPGEHIEDRMATEAVKFIEANKDRPFLLDYWAFSVHAMYNARPSLVEKYRESMDATLPQHNPVYAAMVESLDHAVGTLVKALEKAGIQDNTLIIFFSDNGGVDWQAMKKEGADALAKTYADVPATSNAPLRGGKATTYEGGSREPCFFVWPGVVKPGTRTDAMFQDMDIYPTLAEIAGAQLPEHQIMDGRSLLPVLLGKTNMFRLEIFEFLPHHISHTGQVPAVSVRQGDWKLIRFLYDGLAQAHRYELYNLRNDLGETRDLSAEEPERVKELDARIDWFLKDTQAVVPGPNPAYVELSGK